MNRHERWTKASQGAEKIAGFASIQVQMLGRLDIELIEEDESKRSILNPEDRGSIAQDKSLLFMRHCTLSYLWVLGGYEIIRTVAERSQKGLIADSNLLERISDTKNSFSRLRIPLAKFVAEDRHKNTDYPFAWPSTHNTLGVSWKISDNLFISRRQLSDDLLFVLETIADYYEIKSPTKDD